MAKKKNASKPRSGDPRVAAQERENRQKKIANSYQKTNLNPQSGSSYEEAAKARMLEQKKTPVRTSSQKTPPSLRSGNPEKAAQARNIEQKKSSKKSRKKPKTAGSGFRKFSQVTVVVMVLAGLLLSGLGSISSLGGTPAPEPEDTSNTLTDVNGVPITGEPVPVTPGEESGLETDLNQTPEVPIEFPIEVPAS